jgi:hypothetical protein
MQVRRGAALRKCVPRFGAASTSPNPTNDLVGQQRPKALIIGSQLLIHLPRKDTQ